MLQVQALNSKSYFSKRTYQQKFTLGITAEVQVTVSDKVVE